MPPFSSLPLLVLFSLVFILILIFFIWLLALSVPSGGAAGRNRTSRGVCKLAGDQEKIANSKTPTAALHLVYRWFFISRVDLLPS